jgi:hypothetical protein
MAFAKGQPSANPNGRPSGAKNKHSVSDLVSQNREIKAQLSRMEALQQRFIQSVAVGDVPPFQSVEECLGAIEWLYEGIASGHLEREAAHAHINRLKAFIEAHTRSNFMSFAGAKML